MSLFTLNSPAQPEPVVPATSTSDDLSVQSSVVWVNLRNYGFQKAGAHFGLPQALENLLDQIRQGFILDENTNAVKQRLERDKIDTEIGTIESQITEHQAEIKRVESGEIAALQLQIEQLEEQIRALELQRHKTEKGPNDVNKFNLWTYWLVFIPATLFLYGFYISAFHAAFFRDLIGEARTVGADNISSVLNAVFNARAFNEFNLHWAAPIIFFVFGMVLHIAYDTAHRLRVLRVALTLLFILLADGLLAFFIEDKIHQVKVLMGLDEPGYHFYTSPIFYMVLVLGFFTCLGWSVLLHEIKVEHAKFDVDRLLRTELKQKEEVRAQLQNQIQAWKTKILVIEGLIARLESDITQLGRKRESIILSLWDLNKRVADFYDGWLEYISRSARNQQALLTECGGVYKNFSARYLSSPTPATSGPILAQA